MQCPILHPGPLAHADHDLETCHARFDPGGPACLRKAAGLTPWPQPEEPAPHAATSRMLEFSTSRSITATSCDSMTL